MDQFSDTILALSPTPILRLDCEGRLATWNEPAARYLGISQQLAGQPLSALLPAAAVQPWRDLLAGAASGDSPASPVGAAKSALAGWQVRALFGPRGELTGYCVVIRDTTAPFDANGLSPDAHRVFFEQVPALSFIARIGTADAPELLVLSPQWDMAFGYPFAVWNRAPAEREEVVHPHDRARRRAVLDAALANATTFSVDYRLIGAGGAVHWVRERASSFVDPGAGQVYWVGYVLDITAQKEAEASATTALTQLRESNERLAELSAAKTDFVATISHEFRTPLTSIQGFSELLQSEALSQSEIHAFAQTINENAARLARMISNVLDLEALEAGERQIRRALLDLELLTARVVDGLQPLLTAHRVRTSMPATLPLIMGDPELIEQVFTNIIANAIKYSPDGGAITIAARLRPDAVEITVADEGLGVPPEHRERIFSRYGRIMRNEQHGIEGTGLGLPIARHILEIHNGRIWVEANQPKGSVFHIVLPVADRPDGKPDLA